MIQMCYNGPVAEGKVFRDALASWDGEPCLLMEVGEKVFTRQQESVAQVLRGRAGNQWFIRSVLARGLSDEVIGHTVQDFADTPIGCSTFCCQSLTPLQMLIVDLFLSLAVRARGRRHRGSKP